MSGCRIPANCRLAMANLNAAWERVIKLLPQECEVSLVDGQTIVREQWEKTREAYSGLGLYPTINTGENDD